MSPFSSGSMPPHESTPSHEAAATSAATVGTLLLIIDPQNDFCDFPPHTLALEPLPAPVAATAPAAQQTTGRSPQNSTDASGSHAAVATPAAPAPNTTMVLRPALPVPGADADMRRLGGWIAQNGARIDEIIITLDSHQHFDIAHPYFWRRVDGNGPSVAPFTNIRAADVRRGVFQTANPEHQSRALAYLDALEAAGHYTHMVWPVHCEIGSWGHGIHRAVLTAIDGWQRLRRRPMLPVFKGQNPFTEHYSALRAEVPDPQDEGTQLNRPLLDRIAQAQRFVVAGEAASHCVMATMKDLFAELPPALISRFVLLTDCMSSVTGFERQTRAFLADAQARGATLSASGSFRL